MEKRRWGGGRGLSPLSLLVLAGLLGPGSGWAEVYVTGPSNYRQHLKRLEPGDTLALQAGDYRQGLPIHNLRGKPQNRIHIAGPEGNREAVFHAQRGRNVVSIVDSAYVTVRDLRIDGGEEPVDGVKAEGHSRFAHHITLRHLVIENLARDQQIVGISTKCPARGWVIQDNIIRRAGTGLYLGDSDGTAPFVDGLIEHNLVVNSIGYNLQIKHQNGRPDLSGMPEKPVKTVIRHNVFTKGKDASVGSRARPNVLVGHFPPQGRGSDDFYAIYGNLFYRNPSERLFQGEGNVALYDNLFVNPSGDGLAIMPHNGNPRRIWIFHNTVVARGTGLSFRPTEATREQLVTGNAFFADKPFSGPFERKGGNIKAGAQEAEEALVAPFAPLGRLSLWPQGRSLRRKAALPGWILLQLPDAGQDFEGRPRSGQYAGAYMASGKGPKWRPALEIKPRLEGLSSRPLVGLP